MERIQERMTYANVMSTLAVFIALTGSTAFALKGKGWSPPRTSRSAP